MLKILKSSLIALLMLPTLASAHGPTPLKFDLTTDVNASPEEVWSLVNKLCQIKDWNQSVTDCTSTGDGLGAFREMTLDNGEVLKEEITKVQEDRKRILTTLRVEEGRIIKGMPIRSMGSFLSVTKSENGSKIQIRGTAYAAFEGKSPPPEMSDATCKAAVEAFHTKTLDGMKDYFAAK